MIRVVRALVVAGTRRRLRNLLSTPLVPFAFVLSGVTALVFVVGRLPISGYAVLVESPGAYVYGTRVGSGEAFRLAAGTAGLVFLVVVYAVGVTAVRSGGLVHDATAPHAAATRTRRLVLARLCLYAAGGAGSAVTVATAAAVAFAAGARAPLVVPAGVTAAVAVAVTAAAVTYPVGLTTRLLFVRSGTARRLRLVVSGVAVAGFTGLLRFARQSITVLGGFPPFRWYASLATFPVVPSASLAGAVAAVAVTLATAVVGVGVSVPLGHRLRRADRPEATDDSTTGTIGSPVGRLLARIVPWPVAVTTRLVGVRVVRRPSALSYVAVSAAALIAAGDTLLDRFPGAVLPIVAVFTATAVATGGVLNPIGNENRALPGVLSTPRGARHLLVGYVFSTALSGAAIAVGTTIASAVVTGASPVSTALAAALAVGFGLAVPGIACWLGLSFPSYEGVRPIDDDGLTPPSSQAVAVLVFVTIALGTPAIARSADGVSVDGVLVSLVAVAVVAVAAVRDASRRVQSLDVDE